MPRKKIEDGLTKQQRYQLRKKEKGLCIICGKNKTEQSLCKKCSEENTTVKNYNKNKILNSNKEKIIDEINLILRETKMPLKMNHVYEHIINKLNLNCSTATVRKYYLDSNGKL